MIPDLIFDVGMNNGDDTAHYLRKGYRVVSIEADPTLVEQARTRFADAVSQHRLHLVNVAIAPGTETARFWICQTNSVWNSFDRTIASRDGHTPRGIDVPCRPFAEILDRYGVPFYLKIDIEGHDHFCIDALSTPDLPRYVSFEMDDHAATSLRRLQSLGYGQFKLITQNSHTAFEKDRGTIRRMARAVRYQCRRLRRDWQFPFGSSGPFGEQTDGSWHTLEDVLAIWNWYLEGQSPLGTPGLSFWHDVHARIGTA